MNNKCIWCASNLKPRARECPVCGFRQEVGKVRLPEKRLGECGCGIDRLILAVASPAGDDSQSFLFCRSCIPSSVAEKIARLLIDKKVNFPNEFIADKVRALARGGFDAYRYTSIEMVEGLTMTLGIIYSTKERSSHLLTCLSE